MSITKSKGDLGEIMILADVLKRGYKAALPIGENWNVDLIVQRNGKLERLQCKSVALKNGMIPVPFRSSNNWSVKKYSSKEIDWMAVYNPDTETCFYIPATILDGHSFLNLRVNPTKVKFTKKIRWAKDFLEF